MCSVGRSVVVLTVKGGSEGDFYRLCERRAGGGSEDFLGYRTIRWLAAQVLVSRAPAHAHAALTAHHRPTARLAIYSVPYTPPGPQHRPLFISLPLHPSAIACRDQRPRVGVHPATDSGHLSAAVAAPASAPLPAPNTPIPQYPNTPIPHTPHTPIPQYPNTLQA